MLDLNEVAQIEQYHARGSLFENMVAAELMKNRFNIFRPASMYFWRDANGHEVDFLMREGGAIHLIEAKFSFTPTEQFVKGIEFVRKAAPTLKGENTVVYAGNEHQKRHRAEMLPRRELRNL